MTRGISRRRFLQGADALQLAVFVHPDDLTTLVVDLARPDAAEAVGEDNTPTTYKTQYGHWSGIQNNGVYPYTYIIGDGGRNLQPNMTPHITVYRQDRDAQDPDILTLTPVFDTAAVKTGDIQDPLVGTRALAWNSAKGTVEFSLSPLAPFEATADGGTTVFSPLTSDPKLPSNARITPRSEVVYGIEPFRGAVRVGVGVGRAPCGRLQARAASSKAARSARGSRALALRSGWV